LSVPAKEVLISLIFDKVIKLSTLQGGPIQVNHQVIKLWHLVVYLLWTTL